MPANVFVFLPQHKSSLADLLNSTYGSVRKKKNRLEQSSTGEKTSVLIAITCEENAL